jgi:hypothetical protein
LARERSHSEHHGPQGDALGARQRGVWRCVPVGHHAILRGFRQILEGAVLEASRLRVAVAEEDARQVAARGDAHGCSLEAGQAIDEPARHGCAILDSARYSSSYAPYIDLQAQALASLRKLKDDFGCIAANGGVVRVVYDPEVLADPMAEQDRMMANFRKQLMAMKR